MTLSLKYLDRICLIVVIIITGLSFYGVVRQVAAKKDVIRQTRELFSTRNNDLTLADASFEQLETILAEQRNALEALNERVPDSAEMGEFLKQLDILIKARNIDLATLQPLSVATGPLYTRIPLQMAFRGSFDNVYNLLHDFENMNRMLAVDRMTITRGGDGSCSVKLTASVFER